METNETHIHDRSNLVVRVLINFTTGSVRVSKKLSQYRETRILLPLGGQMEKVIKYIKANPKKAASVVVVAAGIVLAKYFGFL